MATLKDFIAGTVPGASGQEIERLATHLGSLGIRSRLDCARVNKEDIEKFLKPDDCLKFLQKCRTLRLVTQSVTNNKLNILLLGETGAGKSTFINGLVNYLRYSTLEEAELHDGVALIHSSFTLVDNNYTERLITTGSSDNEVHGDGQSSTQLPQTYVFSSGDLTVKLIDTPGVGDTRGLEQDRINIQHIFSHISTFNYLHGICILLQSNQSRITLGFKFCVLETLRNLHKSALHNIVFCFTNCKATNYRPGNTLETLRALLKNENIPIELNRNTVYCVDNEAIRYLFAVKGGAVIGSDEKQLYSTSFDKSASEIAIMVGRISAMKPLPVKCITSLISARRMIDQLTQSLSTISADVQRDITALTEKHDELMKLKESGREKEATFDILRLVKEFIPLDHPRKICLSCNPIRDISQPECRSVKTALVGKNFLGISPLCKECGCPWNKHELMTQELRNVKTTAAPAAFMEIESYVSELEKEIKDLREEQKIIISSGAKFVCFLKANSIAVFNDATDEYFNYLIANAKSEEVEDLKLLKKKKVPTATLR